MSGDQELFRDLEEALWRDDARARFDDILSKDFTDFCRFGHVYDRDDLLGSTAGSVEVEFPFEEFAVQRLADTVALVTYVNTVTKDGVRDRVRRSSIWVDDDGTWRLRFIQATTLSSA